MGRLLDFSQYLGGPDDVEVIEMFPRQQKKFQYNFGSNVSAYTFSADKQTLVLDQVTYDRDTGNINFTDTNVIGYFDNTANISAATYIDKTQAGTGIVTFTIPENRYTGTILPNARENVVMTVVGFEWQDASTPPRKELHRWAIVERWEPGVTIGDPTLDSSFVKLGSGAVAAFSSNASTVSARTAGTYSGLQGLSSKNGEGAIFEVVVATGGATSVKITGRGSGYLVNETITIRDSQLGGGGAPDILVTVTSTI
mgnify:CR=1 FL=1|jgi:hypothetical protein